MENMPQNLLHNVIPVIISQLSLDFCLRNKRSHSFCHPDSISWVRKCLGNFPKLSIL